MTQRSRPTWRELIVPAIGVLTTLYVLVARGLLAAIFVALIAWAIVKLDDALDDRNASSDDHAE